MKKWTALLLSAALLAVGMIGAYVFVRTGPEPEEGSSDSKGLLVKTQTVTRNTHAVDLQAAGSVRPARSVSVLPQVTGKLVAVNPQLEPGGQVKSGAVLARVDPSDYQWAVDQAKASVLQAESQLELERGRQVAARKEWELLENRSAIDEADKSLALREPQLEAAKAQVDSAQASLKLAELNLERTRIRSPFAAVVMETAVEVGQLVTPQTVLSTLADRSAFWVEVAVPQEAIAWLSFGESNPPGTSVQLLHHGITRTGRVLRAIPSVTPRGRMAQILVEIPDPLTGESPLLLGQFVQVTLEDIKTGNWIKIPRKALRGKDDVWVMKDQALEIRTVTVPWRGKESVYVSQGIEDGEHIILSDIAAPVPGLAVRRREENHGE